MGEERALDRCGGPADSQASACWKYNQIKRLDKIWMRRNSQWAQGVGP